MAVITISRQSGSEGNQIVRILRDRLGYQFFDKHLIAQIVSEKGLDAVKIKDITEDEHHINSIWERVFSNLTVPQSASPWVLTRMYEMREEMTVHQVSEFIHAAYRIGNVIIVGRGSQVILKEKPDVLHVRIVAPFETRIRRWMEREHVPYDEAKKITEERDHKHVHFVKTYFDEDINNPELYDLMINTEKLSLDYAADLIIDAGENLPK